MTKYLTFFNKVFKCALYKKLNNFMLINSVWVFEFRKKVLIVLVSFSFLSRFQLRGPLIVWNTMLAMFSIMGAFRTAPELLHVLRHYGLFHSVCVPR